MAKSKDTKTAAKAAAPANGVKAGRVTKPADTPKAKSKETAKSAAKAVTAGKDSKKSKRKEPESSSESESEEEEEVTSASSDSSASEAEDDDSSSEEESEDEKKPAAKAAAPKAKTNGAAKAKAESDSSDESSDEEEDSSEDEEEKPKSAAKTEDVEMADDDEEESDSDSDDSSDEEEEKKPAKPETSNKRKADAEPATPNKKRVKTNGEEVGEPSKNLFVGSLSWNVDEDWLAREFEGFGEIVGCRVITDPNSGRSKGFGYVEFSSVEEATAALDAKQGAEVDGRQMNIDFGKPRPDRSYNNEQVSARANKFGDRQANEPSATLFVGNISFNATQEMISEAFQEYGTVNGVRIPTDQDSGRMKGYGYVEFSSVDEATAAYDALNGADIGGRNVRLDYAAARDNSGGGGGFDSPRGGRGRGGFRGGRGGFDRGGRGGGRGRGGFDRGGRGGGRGGSRGGSTNRGGFGDFKGNKVTF